jgi:hypothetical protein
MITKILELRDRNTFITVIAVGMSAGSEAQRYLLRRAGYAAISPGIPMAVLLVRAQGGESQYDPYGWGDRTFATAHSYIEKEFARLNDGDVVDVEYILGETPTPKVSERGDSQRA